MYTLCEPPPSFPHIALPSVPTFSEVSVLGTAPVGAPPHAPPGRFESYSGLMSLITVSNGLAQARLPRPPAATDLYGSFQLVTSGMFSVASSEPASVYVYSGSGAVAPAK